MQTLINPLTTAGKPFMACLALLLGLSLGACEKDKQDPPIYGLETAAEAKLLGDALDMLAAYVPTGRQDYTTSFVGEIGGRQIAMDGNLGKADPYFTRVRAINGIWVVDNDNPASPLNKRAKFLEVLLSSGTYAPAGGVGAEMHWLFAFPRRDYPGGETAWVDEAMTALFVPGAEIPLLTRLQEKDITSYGEGSTFTFGFSTGGPRGLLVSQSEDNADFNFIRCTSFTRTEEANGIRYLVELDLRHGLAGGLRRGTTDFIPMTGKLSINYLFEG